MQAWELEVSLTEPTTGGGLQNGAPDKQQALRGVSLVKGWGPEGHWALEELRIHLAGDSSVS